MARIQDALNSDPYSAAENYYSMCTLFQNLRNKLEQLTNILQFWVYSSHPDLCVSMVTDYKTTLCAVLCYSAPLPPVKTGGTQGSLESVTIATHSSTLDLHTYNYR